MDSLSFRPVTPADLDELVPLIVRADELTADWAPAGWSLPPDHSERERGTWDEELARDDFRAEIAYDDGVILGVVATKGTWEGEGDGSGHISTLFVEPKAQGRGIGAALLTRAERWLRADGCDRATLNVLEGAPAEDFYKHHGWTRDGRRGRFEYFDLATVGYGKKLSGE
jgi:GNAT superfamily N-acetyltransferase